MNKKGVASNSGDVNKEKYAFKFDNQVALQIMRTRFLTKKIIKHCTISLLTKEQRVRR